MLEQLLADTQAAYEEARKVLPSAAGEFDRTRAEAAAIVRDPQLVSSQLWRRWLQEAAVVAIVVVAVLLLWFRSRLWPFALLAAAIGVLWLSAIPGMVVLLLQTRSLETLRAVLSMLFLRMPDRLEQIVCPALFLALTSYALFEFRRNSDGRV